MYDRCFPTWALAALVLTLVAGETCDKELHECVDQRSIESAAETDDVAFLQMASNLKPSAHKNRRIVAGETVEATGTPQEYAWPSGTGRIEHYTSSKYKAPQLVAAGPAWNWTDPRGRYRTVPNNVNIDHENNIYLLTLDSIRKFSPDGALLWSYIPTRGPTEEMPDSCSLYQGALYVITTMGRVHAVNMSTGKTVWMKQVIDGCDGNNGWLSASEGVLIFGAEPTGKTVNGMGDSVVAGVNATDGELMWKYTPDTTVWNFMGSFAGDGTFTFQDLEGGVYRNKVSDGTNIWKKPGVHGGWTDGSSLLGPNKVVYAVNNPHDYFTGPTGPPGHVSAYRLEDGKLLWRTEVPRPPNNMPAIGRVAGYDGLSLVQPIGQQGVQGQPTDIYVLDAETGAKRWVFHGPSQQGYLQAGDINLVAQYQRSQSGIRSITLPNPWSAPSIDANGVVFIGSEEGGFYSLQDADGNGVVEGDSEVSMFDTKACFSGSSAPAIGENMVVAATVDAMYVFKR